MKASDVYIIAKALPPREMVSLYDMLKKDVQIPSDLKLKRKKLPDFSLEDAIRYIVEHHM